MVMAVFVALAVVPVVLLIAATGVAFGPILGPLYAMAGCLASGSLGFAIGRWLGQQRVEQLGGGRVARVSRVLKRNGTLAVFLVRKVPVPFMLTNIVVGASSVSYRDFLIGTLLGMGGFVVALAGFGYELTQAVRNPSPKTLIAAALFVKCTADTGMGDQPRVAANEAGVRGGFTIHPLFRDGRGHIGCNRKDPGRNRVVSLGAEAPARQGVRSAHTGSMQATNNAARRDASAARVATYIPTGVLSSVRGIVPSCARSERASCNTARLQKFITCSRSLD